MQEKNLNILVDDEVAQTGLLTTSVLERAGHIVDVVHDGQEALDKIGEIPGYYNLLITDNNAAGQSDIEWIEQINKIGFKGAVILCSSAVTADLVDVIGALSIDQVIQRKVCDG